MATHEDRGSTTSPTGARAPSTKRGVRTRAALVTAARTVFERDGYLGARLTDITAEADCSTGSFYTYFNGKDEVFQAVLEAAQDDMLHPGMPRLADEAASPAAVVRASNRAYLKAYKRNARLMQLLEQVAAIDPEFREVRRRRARVFTRRNALAIEALQERGLADPDIDADVAARALSGMVSRMAYSTFCQDERISMTALVEACTRLWVNALQLEPDTVEGTSGHRAPTDTTATAPESTKENA